MGNGIWYMKSFNFTGWNAARTSMTKAKAQVDEMVARCGVNTVTIAVSAQQDHCYSTEIDWKGPHMFADDDLSGLIRYCKGQGLKVVLKPMLNTRDGYWRAYIRFFDEDVPCEPKWGQWFANYTDYMVHMAGICARESVDMMIIGCELVGTDHREAEWRELIRGVRSVYPGPLTYNCDKYQEHNVRWWDALDAISSSGYYPPDGWDAQLDRIGAVVERFGKPFFFSEVGSPSTKGGRMVPNDWTVVGKAPVDLDDQAEFFRTMFAKCSERDWHFGHCIWDWGMTADTARDPNTDGGYSVINKPAQAVIAGHFKGE